MLPVHLAENIRKQVLFYLQSTFDFRDPAVDRAFERFLTDSDTGLFKGPWVQLRRPFRPADEDETIPFDFEVRFHPFKHQARAWRRLTSKDQRPQPTIVTTGTGSGKTECFLFPILDHCLRARRQKQKGIKAIILYPMNALAADQERRFARVVWETEELKRAGIRVGNYTGRYDPSDPGASADSGTKAMGEDNGISNHDVQQQEPPDVLLTNYKMLDYLLLRPQDQMLWRFNEPGVLRYLVLDELHTYDGAQGADVACLIRRLKERLDIPKGELCVVGTSATLDDRELLRDTAGGKADDSVDAKEASSDRLARFASTLFEEDVPADAVIGEDRLTVEEIVHPDPQEVTLPNPSGCSPLDDEDALQFALRQAALWGAPEYKAEILTSALAKDDHELTAGESQFLMGLEAWAVELGEWMKRRRLFKYLLDIFEKAEINKDGPLTWNDLVERLVRNELGFNDYPLYDDRSLICASFFALVAQSKERRSGTAFPLVPTQVQLWIRELRRLGRLVYEKPMFNWLDEPVREYPSLPTFHCSECGEAGWVALHNPAEDSKIEARGVQGIGLDSDPTRIYRGYFGYKGKRSPNIVIISPWSSSEETKDSAVQSELDFQRYYLCPKSLVLRLGDGPCPLTNDPKRFAVKVNQETTKDEKTGAAFGDQGCPNCGSKEGVFFIGSQSATLSSVAIDELFGSTLNDDPKLLAFTDSVQDASHRAGFFTARTYHFTFRTALQHTIDDIGAEGLSLSNTGHALLEWWSEQRAGWRGKIREAMASLLPPDLQEYTDFVAYRDNSAANQPPRGLLKDIEQRLSWEATSEFGLMETHGRTMEATGSACLGWDESRIVKTIEKLRERLTAIDKALMDLPDDSLRLWIYGFLYRGRIRGALDHPYLRDFARSGFWGKYPFGKMIPGRETFPSSGHYKPHLMVTQSQRGHDYVLASTKGSRSPWHVVWARRALNQPVADETSLLDLINALLETGTEVGLFKKLHQDGTKRFYAIAADAAVLTAERVHLVCSQSERSLVRPPAEAVLWNGAPSAEYYADQGRYRIEEYTSRQRYYQERYRKGALRRVFAREHTGLLATEEREQLERRFASTEHTYDPNVLTCTSTLEMGIDIGDLSSTMLCSIPPNTASYLQRIGRAGRATGTALIVSVVNQRPHDLFFYGRPAEMLRGKVDPPGCWLDASAVLVRQYLAFCFDSATKTGQLTDLPRSGKQLVEDMARADGHIPRMMQWVTQNEAELRARFLKRFQINVQPDTRDRFISETASELLLQRIHQAVGEFERMQRDLENARKRLRDQLGKLEEEEQDARQEIEQELKILQGRATSFGRTTALEILTDNGLLPNYAFPERGVRFYGAVYNKYRGRGDEQKPIEVVRPAGTALKELAPGNHFYTHSRRFDIQQIAIGNPQQPLIERWAICGACGHMRLVDELSRPDANPACPQCGHDQDASGQLDLGQHHQFIHFARSQALSHMEHYESLSADSSDERNREYYQSVLSWDLTRDAPSGAVGDEALPFGIEYRSSVVMREVNVGYQGEQGVIAFGADTYVPEDGFRICRSCGIVIPPGTRPDDVVHRRSCTGRRRFEKLKQEGRQGDAFQWEHIFLYRELKSEAIRLLLPIADDDDIDTLTACILLGLRLRFEGNPTYLIVAPQIMPDAGTGMRRYYLVLLDGVPGGTGYLKTLYQEKDAQARDGEGIIQILRLAKSALETCVCRRMLQDPSRQDTDGCYRCIRSYHLQYKADRISRERGITLLTQLIEAGERRMPQRELAAIKPNSLFGSMLEKKFVDVIRAFVDQKNGTWEQTIIRGGQGFRFSLPGSERLWELELQPSLGSAQGVALQSQPDFLLRCDDDRIKPVAIFTDGFQFHCHPANRLADDMQKRRAILASGRFHVWNVTWNDLDAGKSEHVMTSLAPVAQMLQQYANAVRAQGKTVPDARQIIRNGLEQLKAFINTPHAAGWAQLAAFHGYYPLQLLASQRVVNTSDLRSALDAWRVSGTMRTLENAQGAEWVYNDKAALNQDLLAYITVADALSNRQSQVITLARLGDAEAECTGSDYEERWRRFLACLNLFQFSENFLFWTASESLSGTAPEIPLGAATTLEEEWQAVLDAVLPSLRPYVQELAAAGLPVPDAVPQVELFNEQINDDAFAELAWPNCVPPVGVLAGDQTNFAPQWQKQGWKIFTPDDLQAKGVGHLVDQLASSFSGV
ncbi:MAG: helicase [Blastocatellia bacterium AA13]|nr:MAG: helicase [Blastocatellia bacterium AA13]